MIRLGQLNLNTFWNNNNIFSQIFKKGQFLVETDKWFGNKKIKINEGIFSFVLEKKEKKVYIIVITGTRIKFN